VAGKDYSKGYQRYAFAAPFVPEKEVDQGKAMVQAVH